MQTFRITYIDAFGRRNLNSHNFESIKINTNHYIIIIKIKLNHKPFALDAQKLLGEESNFESIKILIIISFLQILKIYLHERII